MHQNDVVKTYIKGVVAEGSIETEFNNYLGLLTDIMNSAKQAGEGSEAAFYLALAYLGAECQP